MLHSIINFFKDVFRKLFSVLRSLLVYVSVAFILLVVLSAVLGTIFPVAPESSYVKEKIVRDEGGKDKIVIANLSGLILSEGGQSVFSAQESHITPSKIERVFLQAKNDPLVRAIIFDINSPGGSPVASDRIFELITNFRRDTDIPVLFLMGDIAASGGYYIAAASDHIVANPATITGSIGVILETYNLEELYEKLGLAKNTFKEGEYKDMLSEARVITEEERQIIQTLNQDTYNLFVSRVASGRNLTEDQVKSIANGQVYSGRQAKDLQLVDSLGNQDEALYQAKLLAGVDRFQVVEYEFSSFFTDLFAETRTSLSLPSILQQLLVLPKTVYVQR